jgi:hypothetical protein
MRMRNTWNARDAVAARRLLMLHSDGHHDLRNGQTPPSERSRSEEHSNAYEVSTFR